MMQKQVVAVAKLVLGNKETLITLIPRENGMLCQTMFFHDEVKGLPNYTKPEIDQVQLGMAETLISGMIQDFTPTQYKDEYQERLKDLIATKIAGKEVVTAAASQDGGNVIDLMEALQKSIEQNQGAAKPKRGKKKGS